MRLNPYLVLWAERQRGKLDKVIISQIGANETGIDFELHNMLHVEKFFNRRRDRDFILDYILYQHEFRPKPFCTVFETLAQIGHAEYHAHPRDKIASCVAYRVDTEFTAWLRENPVPYPDEKSSTNPKICGTFDALPAS